MPDNPLLYLVRHGETDANAVSRYAGWSDDRLNERGRAQAEELAKRLAAEGVRHVFASPVRRTVETAEILGRELDGLVRTVHGLHEISLGRWKGLTEEEVRDRWPEEYDAWRRTPDSFRLEGRETLEEVRARSLEAVDQVARSLFAEPEVPAVLVTHLAVIRVLWLHAHGRPLSAYHEVAGPFCRPYPLRWTGRGRVEPAGPAPSDGDEGSTAGG